MLRQASTVSTHAALLPLSPRRIPISWRVTLLVAITAIFMMNKQYYVMEDALIYARFIANALSGQGLVFNPGEQVNALTSPMFTYVLLGTSWLLRGRIILAEHILFLGSFLGACVLAEDLAPVSGILIAATCFFYTIIGLETTTFLLLLMVTVNLYDRKRYDWLPFVLILALLTRFEAGLLIPVVGWALWRERRLPGWKSLVLALVPMALYLLLNHHLYGTFLPNSATSKLGQARSGLWGHWPWAFLYIAPWAFQHGGMFRTTCWLVPVVLILAVSGWDKMRRMRAGWILTPFSLALFAFYVLFNIPAYHWYFAPFVFVLTIYAILGLRDTKLAYAIAGCCALIFAAQNLLYVRTMRPDTDYINVAEWINANSSPAATVESVEIGTIGWYTHRHVIDILGLTDPKNADHVAHADISSWFAEDKPDYIVVHRPLWYWENVTINSPDYQEAPFHSGNIYLLVKKPSAPVPPTP